MDADDRVAVAIFDSSETSRLVSTRVEVVALSDFDPCDVHVIGPSTDVSLVSPTSLLLVERSLASNSSMTVIRAYSLLPAVVEFLSAAALL